SGVAVVTSNTSALREIAEGYAHLVDPLDIPAMAKAIAQCMSDTDHRAALARLGQRRARGVRWGRAARPARRLYLRLRGLPAPPDPVEDTGSLTVTAPLAAAPAVLTRAESASTATAAPDPSAAPAPGAASLPATVAAVAEPAAAPVGGGKDGGSSGGKDGGAL